jgi:hypothetical protein
MNIYILATIIIIIIICGYFFYKYYSPPSLPLPTISPKFTPSPLPTTKYPLTEQAIMLTFSNNNYTIPYSINIYNNLLNKNLNINNNRSILDTYSSIPFNLNCYVLHTPVFLPNPVKRQGGYYDQITGKVVNNLYENVDYYDIIGAYFFKNFNNLLGNENYQPTYYDNTKEIVINNNFLVNIFNNLKADNTNNQLTLFSSGKMPSLLDDFVPKITMFLLYGLGVNNSSKYVYQTMINKC